MSVRRPTERFTETYAGDRVVVLGKFAGAHGVRGWLRVRSFTEPPENLVGYRTWLVGHGDSWQPMVLEQCESSGREFRVKLAGIDDREQARELAGREIGVRRSELPTPPEGQYYWTDLIGLEAFAPAGESLGYVDHIRETPAHALLVLRGTRERLVPLVHERLLEVDMAGGRLTLDWEPDW